MTTSTTPAPVTSDDAKELIAQQLSRFAADPDAFPAALAARARMPHHYSVANMLLILSQADDPDVLADRIMPRTMWAREGYVPAGRPTYIWSKPLRYWRTESGRVTFKPAEAPDGAKEQHAFKIEPTYPAARVVDGNGRTGETRPEPLTGDAAEVYGRVAAWLTGKGWTVQDHNVDGAGGWTSHAGHLVRIDPRFTGWDRVRVIVHEATHALMHADHDDYVEHRGDREAEADGVAYAVLTAYGQSDAAGRAVRYVAEWTAGETDRITAAIERASAALDALMAVAAGDDAEVRKPRTGKADNHALAEWLRSHGLPVRGAVWAAAKAGERDVDTLHALAA